MDSPRTEYQYGNALLTELVILRRKATMQNERGLRYEVSRDDYATLERLMVEIGVEWGEPGRMPRVWSLPLVPSDETYSGRPTLILQHDHGVIQGDVLARLQSTDPSLSPEVGESEGEDARA